MPGTPDAADAPGGPDPDAVVRGARLAVDVGSVRVGLAASDPDGLVATPVDTLPRDTRPPAPGSLPSDVATIVAEVAERFAAAVYVGLPKHLSGTEGSAAQAARAYAGALAQAVAPVPVRLVDERMSTVSAHQALHASGRSGRRHRAVVDQAAAVVILQTALDAERSSGRRPGERVTATRPEPPAEERPGGRQDAGRAGHTEGTTE
ncbi:Holliday junction resolvase RuvX [Cellulomonas sp. PS-H5]|uniref:Holliday junction resolvase RuvX n=1 Tax=Cellulomonas sp. PS-H5 TaxID=2820400 RepID=UPI001C4FA2E4|nr:Holliday junction resolvase RuvX [Cellulomonas sp. PS-H5]MBW0255420.1 Holliday junction resolvase RuvX [Cellulomonas sp. PS-H5]